MDQFFPFIYEKEKKESEIQISLYIEEDREFEKLPEKEEERVIVIDLF